MSQEPGLLVTSTWRRWGSIEMVLGLSTRQGQTAKGKGEPRTNRRTRKAGKETYRGPSTRSSPLDYTQGCIAGRGIQCRADHALPKGGRHRGPTKPSIIDTTRIMATQQKHSRHCETRLNSWCKLATLENREHLERKPETNYKRRETTPKHEEPRNLEREAEGTLRLRGVINTIVGEFVRGSTSSTRKRYMRIVNNVHSKVNRVRRKLPLITFTDQDFVGTDPKQNDPMIITVEVANFDVKKVLIDQGSLTKILYMSTFR
ncbi:hypothetical protein CR513_35327, partial [Mucuna pruriens]